MVFRLKNIIGIIALVVMFTACSKDSELFTPSTDNIENTEKKNSSKGETNCGKPTGDNSNTGSGLPEDTTDPEDGGPVVVDGISDDDDDESDDDSASRSGSPR